MEVVKISEKEDKNSCCVCGELLSLTGFYKSNSPFYNKGILPICKECFGAKFGEFTAEYHSAKKAMKRLCMAFDIYFDDTLFDKCNTNDATLGNYFRKLNMSQYKNKTFSDSLQNGFYFAEEKNSINKPPTTVTAGNDEIDDNNTIASEDIDKWGVGFEKVDYDVLNAHYKYLKTANPNCDSNQEIFVIDLCYIHMQKMKALRNSDVDGYNKLTESYRKSFNQAGLKTADTMKTDDDCWSLWVDRVSQFTPEEFYKNKERYKDFDGLGEYYERFAVRPLRNIELGTEDRDYEFYVHEEE